MSSSVQFSSVAQSCPSLFDPMNHSTPGLPVHHQLPEFTQTHVHQVSDAIQPSHPLSPPSPPAPNRPSIRVFSSESTLHMRWPKSRSFRFSISPSNEHPGLISFRMNWLDPLAIQGTLKSLLQHHSSKASKWVNQSLKSEDPESIRKGKNYPGFNKKSLIISRTRQISNWMKNINQ